MLRVLEWCRRHLTRIALVAGLAVLVALVIHEGALSIADLLSHAGWVLLLLVPLHAVPLWFDVMGWRLLIPGACRVRGLLYIASIREAVNRLLPVASIGGELVGVHLLSRQGTDATAAAASVIVEVALTLVAQYVFLILGVAGLLQLSRSVEPSGPLVLSLLAGLPVLVALWWLLRSGVLVRALERLAGRVLGARALRAIAAGGWGPLNAAIRSLAAAHGRLARALLWQLAGLIVGCAETWLALRWLGHPVGFLAALSLEGVTLAARTLIFMVPAGLGVQEAGLIGVGHVLGIGSDLAVALSLVKRMREILFGVPALAAWQWSEARRLVLDLSGRDVETP